MAVIFDLDQTLVNSSCLEPLRRSKQWSRVYAAFGSVVVYPGICDLLQRLKAKNVPMCIVTNSPNIYAQKLSRHCGFGSPNIIGYHDVAPRLKPDPAAYVLAMKQMNVTPEETIAIGDARNDILAAHEAKIQAAAALWGSKEAQATLTAKPHYQFETVGELATLLQERYSL